MFYSGFDPMTMKPIYVARDYEEKQMQRALLQFARPANAPLVRKALIKAGREDLIGHGRDCLVRPAVNVQSRTPKGKPNGKINASGNKRKQNQKRGKKK